MESIFFRGRSSLLRETDFLQPLLDVRCFGSTEFANKKAFTEAAFEAVQQATGLPEDGIYLTYSEFANWGTKGSMK